MTPPSRDPRVHVVRGGKRPGIYEIRPNTARAGESLAAKLARFFQENPDEELTREQVAEKYGVHINTVDVAMRQLKDGGAFEFARVFRLRMKGMGR